MRPSITPSGGMFSTHRTSTIESHESSLGVQQNLADERIHEDLENNPFLVTVSAPAFRSIRSSQRGLRFEKRVKTCCLTEQLTLFYMQQPATICPRSSDAKANYNKDRVTATRLWTYAVARSQEAVHNNNNSCRLTKDIGR